MFRGKASNSSARVPEQGKLSYDKSEVTWTDPSGSTIRWSREAFEECYGKNVRNSANQTAEKLADTTETNSSIKMTYNAQADKELVHTSVGHSGDAAADSPLFVISKLADNVSVRAGVVGVGFDGKPFVYQGQQKADLLISGGWTINAAGGVKKEWTVGRWVTSLATCANTSGKPAALAADDWTVGHWSNGQAICTDSFDEQAAAVLINNICSGKMQYAQTMSH